MIKITNFQLLACHKVSHTNKLKCFHWTEFTFPALKCCSLKHLLSCKVFQLCIQVVWNNKGTWDSFTSQPHRKGILHTAPNSYLSVDYHIWRTLLWVSSLSTTRISGCLGHVCLSSLRLQGQEQESASLHPTVEHGKDMQPPPKQTDKDGTEGITLQTSPHAGCYHTELTGLWDNAPRTRTTKLHTAVVWVITHTHLSPTVLMFYDKPSFNRRASN